MVVTESLSISTRQVLRADAAMAGVILLLGSFLVVSGNSLVQRWQSSSARQQTMSYEDQLGFTASFAGFAVIIWWAVSLAIAFTAAVLERGGRARAAQAAGRFSPGFMRRLALAAVGLQLIGAQLATAATPPAAAPPPGPAVSAAWIPLPEPAPAAYRDPAGSAPAAQMPAEDTPAVDPQWKPLQPVVEPGLLASRPLRPRGPSSPGETTVRAGDSLWSLSAAQLGPLASAVDIAAAWPRLYQANRQIIGEDPDLLLPGQVLKLPPCT